jgi:uncharacterized protein
MTESMESPVATRASMLLRFEATNARSFRDRLEINFLSTALSEPSVVRQIAWRADGAPIGVLPAACIFGPNASGKSNVLRVMHDMRSIVLRSFRRWDPVEGTERSPFKLDSSSRDMPSRFEVDLVLDGVRHIYGFELDDARILTEWAFRYPRGQRALLFRREGQEVEFGASLGSKDRGAADLLRPNALLLSTAAAVSQPHLQLIYEWFRRNFQLAEASTRSARHLYTADMISDDKRHADQVLALVRAADLGITNVRRKPLDPRLQDQIHRIMRAMGEETGEGEATQLPDLHGLVMSHRGEGGEVELDIDDESLGTMVWLGMAGPLVECLAEGSVFLADEIDASLHPALVRQIVRLFQDPATNPHRAQIVFNSHNANLLGESEGKRLLGRDQIWFADKDHRGRSTLRPLSDFGVRKGEAVGRRYLAGHYGAVPIVSNADFDEVAHLITSSASE